MNLARWNIIVSPVCILCHSTHPTTNHVLTGCSVALAQGRYTWRHDSVLQVLVRGLQRDLPPFYKLYADLPGYLASVSPPSTIPSNLSSSLSRPDLVLVSDDSITLFELSVVTNTKHHLSAANSRKEDRYGPLLLDLQRTSLSVQLITIEVGCLGHFMPETLAGVSRSCNLPKRKVRSLFENAARVAISCSYRIFNARSSELWDVTDLFN